MDVDVTAKLHSPGRLADIHRVHAVGKFLSAYHPYIDGFCSEGNYTLVRVAAFEALLLNKWFSRKSLARYLFAVIASDSSRIVRRFVARAAITSLGLLEAMRDIRYTAKDGEKPVLIEEDGAFPTNAKQARRGEAKQALKAIRRDAGKQKGVREIFIPTFL